MKLVDLGDHGFGQVVELIQVLGDDFITGIQKTSKLAAIDLDGRFGVLPDNIVPCGFPGGIHSGFQFERISVFDDSQTADEHRSRTVPGFLDGDINQLGHLIDYQVPLIT